MTTNIDRAAEVLGKWHGGAVWDTGNPNDLAQALADAGLLAPDPHRPEAVAEVARLRRELERLREDMDRRERLAGAFGVSALVESIVSSRITRILEGTNE